ncbi:MAG: sugar phosphate isomerase/epimerase [Pseudoalteromonas tetraodonis]|jgi:sugar phosphate isomerase/epimerase
MSIRTLVSLSIIAVSAISPWASAGDLPDNLEKKNLVAWCIVPLDAKKRGPAERAVMLKELGIGRCAYDWRKENVEEFEEEILEYKKHDIEYFAFWGSHEKAFELFKKYDVHPQIWQTAPGPKEGTQDQKVAAAADTIEALAKRTKELGSKLGLYNHGGWGGEPENLVGVCKELHERGHEHVGIVYNWHHGHAEIKGWKESLKMMKPYLLCLNLNGMNDDAEPKILALGEGKHEKWMLNIVIESGYEGPIGILDHQRELDSEKALKANLDGLTEMFDDDGETLKPYFDDEGVKLLSDDEGLVGEWEAQKNYFFP